MSLTTKHDALHALKLDGMAEIFSEWAENEANRKADPVEWIRLMVEQEQQNRGERRLQPRLRAAKLRDDTARVDLIDYVTKRNLDQAQLNALALGQWIAEHRTVLITGPCGVGKSYIACALAHAACRQDKAVLYFRMPQFLAELDNGHKTEQFDRVFNKIVRADALILDDWSSDIMTPAQRRDLMETIDARYERKATVVTSQLPVDKWYDMIADPTLADAIVDSLAHRAHRISMDGPSMRK